MSRRGIGGDSHDTARLLVLAAVVAIAFPGAASAASAPALGCTQPAPQTRSGSPPSSAVREAGGLSAATLSPADDNSKVIERNFGESRHVYRRPLAFNASEPLDASAGSIEVSVAGGLVDPKTTDVFSVEDSQVTFGAEVDQASPERLLVKVCIDPSHPDHVAPGKYVGSLLISGRGISPSQIPITLTLKYSHWLVVWILALVGAAAGVGARILARKLNKKSRLSGARIFWIAAIGLVGAVGVVVKLYYAPSTFGGSPGDLWPIAAGGFGAAVGGAGVVASVKEPA